MTSPNNGMMPQNEPMEPNGAPTGPSPYEAPTYGAGAPETPAYGEPAAPASPYESPAYGAPATPASPYDTPTSGAMPAYVTPQPAMGATVPPMNGQPMPGQPMPGQPMPPMGQPQPQPQKSGLAIAGLIVGACGLFVCWIPILNVIGMIMGIVGLVLSIIGIVVTMQNKRTGKVLAIVGAVLSGLALILSIVVNVVVINAVNDALDDKAMSEIQEGLKDLDNKAKNKSDSDGATIMQGEGQLEDAYVKIAGVKGGLKDYDGDPAIMVTFEWTNTSDENAPFMTAIDASAFQDGHELETTTFAYNEQPSGYDSGSTIKDLQPNSKGTVTIAYKLENDKSPVTIECEDWFSIHSTDKVVQKFELQ